MTNTDIHNMSMIEIRGTAPDADPETFPLNTLVRFNSDDASMTERLGKTGSIVDFLAILAAVRTVPVKCAVMRVEDSDQAEDGDDDNGEKNYVFNAAMSIRAYGTVTISGTSPEDARSKITADLVADKFEPHGSNEDLDYQHPSDIALDGTCYEGDDWDTNHEFEPVTIQDGDWINDPLGKAAPDMLAALNRLVNIVESIRADEECDASTQCGGYVFGDVMTDALEAANSVVSKAKGGAAPTTLETAQSLEAKYGRWQDHPDYSDGDWRNDETRLGYWEWVASKVNGAEGGAA